MISGYSEISIHLIGVIRHRVEVSVSMGPFFETSRDFALEKHHGSPFLSGMRGASVDTMARARGTDSDISHGVETPEYR